MVMDDCYHLGAIESLLDVGVRGGRTTKYLLQNERKNNGSAAVQICSHRRPTLSFIHFQKMEPINCRSAFGTDKLPKKLRVRVAGNNLQRNLG